MIRGCTVEYRSFDTIGGTGLLQDTAGVSLEDVGHASRQYPKPASPKSPTVIRKTEFATSTVDEPTPKTWTPYPHPPRSQAHLQEDQVLLLLLLIVLTIIICCVLTMSESTTLSKIQKPEEGPDGCVLESAWRTCRCKGLGVFGIEGFRDPDSEFFG